LAVGHFLNAINAKDGILKMIKDDDKVFIVALIEEAIDGLNELKDAIENEDKAKYISSLSKVSALKQAARKWMEE
jgi:hypothetical protein